MTKKAANIQSEKSIAKTLQYVGPQKTTSVPSSNSFQLERSVGETSETVQTKTISVKTSNSVRLEKGAAEYFEPEKNAVTAVTRIIN